MRTRTIRVLTVTIGFIVTMLLFTHGYAQNFEQEYLLYDGQTTFQLTLSITPELHEHYLQKSHQLTQGNFGSFVTPYSLELVASDIRSISTGEENFVNLVLMIVHQLPYEIVEEAKYPVETIIDNKGDCDCFSFFAASLLKAEDFDVVLLYYEEESHMNIGVHLPQPPTEARTPISYVDYMGTRYYMAECTGEDWQNGWRVGERPPELEDAQVTVVTLENYEQIAPGRVSSSFGSLEDSAISLTIPSNCVREGVPLVMNGQVSIPNPGGTVTLYAGAGNSWFSIGTVDLDSNGRFSLTWIPTAWGQYFLKASWSGNDEYAGADSQFISIYVIPEILVFLVGALLMTTIVSVTVILMYKTTHYQETQVLEAAPE